jgi:hypothetical protein
MQDGYDISMLDYCPEGEVEEVDQSNIPLYLQKIGLMNTDDNLRGQCYDCPPDPWVVLAQVTVDDDGVVSQIDNCSCRRIVISFGPYALRCHTQLPTVTSVDPSALNAGETKTVVMTGTNFREGMKMTFGPGITVDYTSAKLEQNNTKYTVNIKVDQNARPGKKAVTVINPDCATATYADKFEVNAGAAPMGFTPAPQGPMHRNQQSPAKPGGGGSKKVATKTRQPGTKTNPTDI